MWEDLIDKGIALNIFLFFCSAALCAVTTMLIDHTGGMWSLARIRKDEPPMFARWLDKKMPIKMLFFVFIPIILVPVVAFMISFVLILLAFYVRFAFYLYSFFGFHANFSSENEMSVGAGCYFGIIVGVCIARFFERRNLIDKALLKYLSNDA